MIVLITDDYAHQHNLTAKAVIQQLKSDEFLVFVISVDAAYYRSMATENGGTWSEILENSSLNDLMELFKEIAEKISEITQEVHVIGAGSVAKYLAFMAPKP